MKVTATLDATGFFARMRQLSDAKRTRARTMSAAVGASVFIKHVTGIGIRRDTRRYVRGWQIANNQAGLPAITVEPVRESKYAADYLMILGDQIIVFQAMVERLERIIRKRFINVGRPMRGQYYHELEQRLFRARERLEKSERQMALAEEKYGAGDATFLFMGVFNSEGRYIHIRGRRTKGKTARQLVSIRTKVYGGLGRLVVNGYQSVFVMVHKEPHAAIIERKYRYVTHAMQYARGAGVRKIQAKYVEGIQMLFGEGD